MRVGFWSEPEGEDVQMTVAPVGGTGRHGGLTGTGAISALASRDGGDLARQCPGAAALLPQMAAALAAQRADAPTTIFPLDQLSEPERRLIGDVLGEGEVSGLVALPDGQTAQIQESVLAGLWRIRIGGDGGGSTLDYAEVGAIPELARRAAHDFTAPDLTVAGAPDGAMNVMPLLAEIRERMSAHRPGAGTHVVNFTLLPMSPADMAFLQTTLGNGPVQLFSRGYGTCRVLATGARYVWSVQFTNAMDTVILDTIEIGDVPAVACAADEDFQDSAERLNEILEAYFS